MKKLGKSLIAATLLTTAGVAIVNTSQIQPQGIVFAANNSRTKSKISDSQIMKNLKITKTTNAENEALTAKYKALVGDVKYTFANPYIKVNPYENAPLSALMIFHTDQAAQVSYKIIGKSSKTTISNKVDGYETNHQVPIVGLYAGYTNKVEVTLTYQDGKTETKTFDMKTINLPKHIRENKIELKNVDKDKMDIGDNKLTVLARTSKQTFAVDADGQVRWYYLRWNQHIFKQLNNGHILMLNKVKTGAYRYNLLVEMDYLGRIYNQYQFDDTLNGSYSGTKGVTVVHHDICELPNGNFLATVNDGSKNVEDTVAEINRNTGKVVKVIDFKKILPESMYKNNKIKSKDDATQGLGLMDWLHINSVNYDEKTGDLLLSARNQDMIWSINYKTKKLNWIFTNKKASSWPASYRKYLLTPSKGTKYTGGQHDLYLLNHDGDKLDILLYDNNIAVTNGDKSASGKYSAATQYQIDTSKKTIKQIWTYGKSLGKSNHTMIIGSAQRLSDGNTLIDFGFKDNGKQSNIIEVDKNNKQVFNLTLNVPANSKGYVYRAYRMEFYPSAFKFDLTK